MRDFDAERLRGKVNGIHAEVLKLAGVVERQGEQIMMLVILCESARDSRKSDRDRIDVLERQVRDLRHENQGDAVAKSGIDLDKHIAFIDAGELEWAKGGGDDEMQGDGSVERSDARPVYYGFKQELSPVVEKPEPHVSVEVTWNDAPPDTHQITDIDCSDGKSSVGMVFTDVQRPIDANHISVDKDGNLAASYSSFSMGCTACSARMGIGDRRYSNGTCSPQCEASLRGNDMDEGADR